MSASIANHSNYSTPTLSNPTVTASHPLVLGESSEQLGEEVELSIVMPCLNEAETLGACIQKANQFLQDHAVKGEIIVADNGSTDGSQKIAADLGARVIDVEQKGYGAALMGGIAAARGQYIIMGDSDDSYDFTALAPFVEKLRQGYDLVMGNRFKGGIAPGAMPPLHKYLGNPVLSWLGRLFFPTNIGDFHCGLRGFRRDSVLNLNLQTTGMEFASEMVVKAVLHDQRVSEVPTTLSPDGRSRSPHLNSWRDGWRHLRFLLMYSPRWLFLIPGLVMFGLGFIMLLALVWGPLRIAGLYFDVHYMVLGSLLALIGFQIINLGVYAKVYSIAANFSRNSRMLSLLLKYFNLERGILVGSLIFVGGLSLNLYILVVWLKEDFGFAGQPHLREAILAMTLMVIGLQIIFSSFFLSLLSIKKRK